MLRKFGRIKKMPLTDHLLMRNKARHSVRVAIMQGVIKRPEGGNCQKCGKPCDRLNLHGHHPDYNNPLEIIWLCVSCHKRTHLSQEPTEDFNGSNIREQLPIHKCPSEKCGYQWIPRKADPLYCPRCRFRLWKQEIMDGSSNQSYQKEGEQHGR